MPSGDLSCYKEKTMKVRVILVCTLLLLAAVPTFALPLCAHCNEWNMCESASGDFERCKYDLQGNCITTTERCSIPSAASTVLAEYKVAAVEISRPSTECVTAAAPSATSDLPAPAARATELK
jgi:hypothetical protein